MLTPNRPSTMPTMPSIALSELPLRPSTLSLLTRRGFVSTGELEESRTQGMATFASELDVPLQEAANLLREVQGCLLSSQEEEEAPITAHDLLHQNAHQRNHIVTFAKQVDQLLGGGIALGQLTEIAGMPGTAKTQLAMQLSVLCRLPRVFGGVEGRALYIDAEGSFAPERCQQMAEALVQHVEGSKRSSSAGTSSSNLLTPEEILESIQVFRVHDETSQTATLRNLTSHLRPPSSSNGNSSSENELPVKLIVLDSIAFHYRAITPTNHKYYLQRTKDLVSLASFLSDLARKHHLAVVCINQMTTKIVSQKTHLVPALGESWAHAVTTRLLLSRQQQSSFSCKIVKSPHRPSGTAHFQVLRQGIRGLAPKTPPQPNPTIPHATTLTARTPTAPRTATTTTTAPQYLPQQQRSRTVTPHPPMVNHTNADTNKRRRVN